MCRILLFLSIRVHDYSVGAISSMEHVSKCLENLSLTSVKASDIVRVSDAERIACGIDPDQELSKCIFVLAKSVNSLQNQ